MWMWTWITWCMTGCKYHSQSWACYVDDADLSDEVIKCTGEGWSGTGDTRATGSGFVGITSLAVSQKTGSPEGPPSTSASTLII